VGKQASILKNWQRMRDVTHTALRQLTFNKFAPISDLCQIMSLGQYKHSLTM